MLVMILVRLLPVDLEQIVGRAIQQQTQSLDSLHLDGLGLIHDHLVEILIAHTQLLV